jgi:hypothetical protein
MTKILSSATYDALKEKADNFDKVINSVVAKNDDLKPEDVTLEVIEAAISSDVEDPALQSAVTTLEGTVEQLNGQITSLTTERDDLASQVAALSGLPGAASVSTAKPDAEASAVETDDLVSFANEHKGDTMAIASKMREAGYGK